MFQFQMLSLTVQHTCERQEMSTKCQWEILKGGARIGPGTHPAFCSLASGGLFPSIKWLKHLSPLIAEVKTEWLCTSTALCAFMACIGTTFPFILSVNPSLIMLFSFLFLSSHCTLSLACIQICRERDFME